MFGGGWMMGTTKHVSFEQKIVKLLLVSCIFLDWSCWEQCWAHGLEKIARDMPYNFERIYHIVDSMIVMAQIQRKSYGFRIFTATRVVEIQDRTKKGDGGRYHENRIQRI